MEQDKLKCIVEGALFSAGKALSIQNILQLFDENGAPSTQDIKSVLALIDAQYQSGAVVLKELATGYCFLVRTEYSPWVSRLWAEKAPKYSRAILETLAIIAYRQPITRGEIEDIRGVSTSSHIVKTLLEREWVRIVGHREVPGRPALFATTRQFLAYFALKSLDELPTLTDIVDLDNIILETEDNTALPSTPELPFDAPNDAQIDNTVEVKFSESVEGQPEALDETTSSSGQ